MSRDRCPGCPELRHQLRFLNLNAARRPAVFPAFSVQIDPGDTDRVALIRIPLPRETVAVATPLTG